VRHATERVNSSMSQYSSTCYVITNIKQLLILRNNKHTDPSRTNRSLNAKRHQTYYNV